MFMLQLFYVRFLIPAWVAEGSSCAMSGLSWGYFGRTWGLAGSTSAASCAMLEQFRENLEATWLNLGSHSVCEIQCVGFTAVFVDAFGGAIGQHI